MPGQRIAALTTLIAALRAIWAEDADPERRMRKAQGALEAALADRQLLAHSKSWPSTVGQNLLFYEDPDYGFALNATVRPPGSRGQVHDHAHAWTLYGILDGKEHLERYQRHDDGAKPGHAEIALVSDTWIEPGTIDFVAPWEIHAERGGDGRSVALIVRSERLVGRVLQKMFDPTANTVREAPGPEQVPYEVLAD